MVLWSVPAAGERYLDAMTCLTSAVIMGKKILGIAICIAWRNSTCDKNGISHGLLVGQNANIVQSILFEIMQSYIYTLSGLQRASHLMI